MNQSWQVPDCLQVCHVSSATLPPARPGRSLSVYIAKFASTLGAAGPVETFIMFGDSHIAGGTGPHDQTTNFRSD